MFTHGSEDDQVESFGMDYSRQPTVHAFPIDSNAPYGISVTLQQRNEGGTPPKSTQRAVTNKKRDNLDFFVLTK